MIVAVTIIFFFIIKGKSANHYCSKCMMEHENEALEKFLILLSCSV